MSQQFISPIAHELALKTAQVEAAASLLEAGATVPFIARYRKEATGNLDELLITSIRDRLRRMEALDTRRQAVLKSMEQHGHMTDELKERVNVCSTLAELEDLYLPYRPKRRTRAAIAREKGLGPLADHIFQQRGTDPLIAARMYVDPEKQVMDVADALAGARDIMAEMFNEDPRARTRLRQFFHSKAVFKSTVGQGMESRGTKFKDYFDWQEPAATAPSHRVLAMRRGEMEDVLNLAVLPPEKEAIKLLKSMFVTGHGPDSLEVEQAVGDCYRRLLSHAMETEIRLTTKETADTAAIKIFSQNLRELLLAPPLGAKNVMGIDPGFRTGCKLACLDRQGKLLHHATVYPHGSAKTETQAGRKVAELCRRYAVEAIAVGNGTAGRETLAFLRGLALPDPAQAAQAVQLVMVNESGASVYSASKVAREEFPDLDLTVRGAVSIGRRLMDPLAELVKIDPKSIGVGQYQHDVDQKALRQALDDVVKSCVNAVGVDVNRASVQLLTYVSGLGPQLAKNIVDYRNENGAFGSRKQLKNVHRLGPKAFEQCAGFLRIMDGDHPLDAGAVHPESYPIVDAMAADLGCTVRDLMSEAALRKKIDIRPYVTESVGIPTLQDILKELDRPGRDPRKSFAAFEFADHVEKIDDLEVGMQLPGTVTNVTAFGAFVDIGVHQDGLVHISQLADRFIKDPSQVVKVNQKVKVTVMQVDLERKRISLSMRSRPGTDHGRSRREKSPAKRRKAAIRQKDDPN